MRLLFKQRFTFGFDTYDIYNEADEPVFTVKDRFSFGRKLEIYDRSERYVGMLVGKVFSFMPTYEMYVGDSLVGKITKEITFFKPEFTLDCNGWTVSGNWWEYDYSIRDENGRLVATISKEFALMDTYTLDVYEDSDSLAVLMIVLAIDCEKDTRD